MKKNDINEIDNEDDDSGSGAQGTAGGTAGGTSGEVKFRYKDAMSVGPRDDMLPDVEIKRLLAVHQELHKGRVDNQKQTRKERAVLKEGRKLQQTAQQQLLGLGGGAGGMSQFKQHPISAHAQFSGTDKQVTGIPTENEAQTNNDIKNEKRYVPQNAPKFNPKPQPR